jgi:hypothetical protein
MVRPENCEYNMRINKGQKSEKKRRPSQGVMRRRLYGAREQWSTKIEVSWNVHMLCAMILQQWTHENIWEAQEEDCLVQGMRRRE